MQDDRCGKESHLWDSALSITQTILDIHKKLVCCEFVAFASSISLIFSCNKYCKYELNIEYKLCFNKQQTCRYNARRERKSVKYGANKSLLQMKRGASCLLSLCRGSSSPSTFVSSYSQGVRSENNESEIKQRRNGDDKRARPWVRTTTRRTKCKIK